MAANFSSGNTAKSIVAANVKVIFGGILVGFVTEASWTIEYNNKPIYVVDSIVPAEIAPGPYRVSFTLSGTRLLTTNLEDNDWVKYPGMNLNAAYTSIAIVERASGNALVNIKAAMIDSVQTTIAAKSLAVMNISGTGFVALSSSPEGVPPYTGVPQQLPET